MAIPLLAAGAAKAAAATAAKAAIAKAAAATAAKAGTAAAIKAGAATAAKAGAATAAKTGAGLAAKTGAAKLGTSTAAKTGLAGTKGKLSLGMLQDPKVNVYPGSKVKTFAKKAGKYLESAGGQAKEMKWSEPTKAGDSLTGSLPTNPDSIYSKQIDKLDTLRK